MIDHQVSFFLHPLIDLTLVVLQLAAGVAQLETHDVQLVLVLMGKALQEPGVELLCATSYIIVGYGFNCRRYGCAMDYATSLATGQHLLTNIPENIIYYYDQH